MEQDFLDLSFLDENFVIDFDEIASDVGDIVDFDNMKLMENNNVSMDVPAPPCEVVQPASPSIAFIQEQPFSPDMFLMQPVSSEILFESALSPCSSQTHSSDPVYLQPANPDTTFIQVQEQPLSRGMFLMQAVSPGTSIESTLLPYSTQTHSPDPVYLQPGTPEPFLMQPASPDQHYVAPLSPCVVQIKEEVAPVQIKEQPVLSFGDEADAPRKRGRKRKYPEGSVRPRDRSKKTIKVYQMAPLEDEIAERKRKNAVNAKLHREKQKNERDYLLLQLEQVISERDSFKKQLEELKQKLAKFQGFMPF